MFLGYLTLVFFFGFLLSHGQKFNMLSLLLVYLSVLFLQSNKSAFESQSMWSNRCWILGASALGISSSLFKGFLTACWRTSFSLEIESLWIWLTLGGLNLRHSSICQSRNIILSCVCNNQVENTQNCQQKFSCPDRLLPNIQKLLPK